MPNRRASILPPIILCGLLLMACGAGGGRQGESAVADSSTAAPASPATEGKTVAGDSVEVTALLRSLNGELRIEAKLPRNHGDPLNRTTVQAGERTLLVDSVSRTVTLFSWWDDPRGLSPEGSLAVEPLGSIALLQVMSGGSGCPALFRVVELMRDGSAAITEEFGTCAEWPEAVWFDRGGTMRMRFSDHASAPERSEPGFREGPPRTWIYRTGGHLEEMKGR
jgi:hypothetical protein